MATTAPVQNSSAGDTQIAFTRPDLNYSEGFKNPNPADQTSDDTKIAIDAIANYVRGQFELHRTAKLPIENEILDCMRRCEGIYPPDKLSAILGDGLPPNFRKATSQKCRDAEVAMNLVLNAAKRWFSLEPNPLPDLDDEVSNLILQHTIAKLQVLQQMGHPIPNAQDYPAQYVALVDQHMDPMLDQVNKMRMEFATKIVGNMQTKIDDQLLKGEWTKTIKKVIHDAIRLPGGILEGPVIQHRTRKSAQKDPATGKWTTMDVDEYVPAFERIDPIDFFPAPQVENIEDGDIIVRRRFSRQKFASFVGIPGFNDDNVKKAIMEMPDGFDLQLPIDQQVKTLNSQNVMVNAQKILQVLQFNGYIDGQKLLDWGLDETTVPDANQVYDVECLVVGHLTVKVIVNPVRMCSCKFSMMGFQKRSNSCWYHGIPHVMADVQDEVNQLVRMSAYNIAIAAGSMAAINVDKMAPGEDIGSLYPGRTFLTQSNPRNPGDNGKAVEWFESPLIADRLLSLRQYLSTEADNVTGIPSFSHGDASGALPTASGFAMQNDNAGRGIKDLVSCLLSEVVDTRLAALYLWNMQYIDDDSIKGDATVNITDAISVMAKQQEAGMYKDLLTISNNPTDNIWIKAKNRAAMYRGWIGGMSMPTEEAIPSDDEIDASVQQMQAQMAAQAPQTGPDGASPPGAPIPGQIPSSPTTDQAGNPVSGGAFRTFNPVATR
jgi:hypothetical protein